MITVHVGPLFSWEMGSYPHTTMNVTAGHLSSSLVREDKGHTRDAEWKVGGSLEPSQEDHVSLDLCPEATPCKLTHSSGASLLSSAQLGSVNRS